MRKVIEKSSQIILDSRYFESEPMDKNGKTNLMTAKKRSHKKVKTTIRI